MRRLLLLLPLSVVAIFAAAVSCGPSTPPVVMANPVSGEAGFGATASHVNGGYNPAMERPRKRPGDLLGEVMSTKILYQGGCMRENISDR